MLKYSFPKSEDFTSSFRGAVTITSNLHCCGIDESRYIAVVGLRTLSRWCQMGNYRPTRLQTSLQAEKNQGPSAS